MIVLHAVGWLFSGVLLVNTIPHLVHGVSGDRFPSPFARPYGKKLTGPVHNVIWAFINLGIVAVIMYFNYPSFSRGNAAIMIVGGFGMSVFLANYFSRKDAE